MSNQSPVAAFTVNGERYSQYLDLSNDSVYLADSNGVRLLEFTSDCDVFELVVPPKRLGHYRLRNNHWVFTDEQTKEKTIGSSFQHAEGLLDDEVAFSKKWLTARVAQ